MVVRNSGYIVAWTGKRLKLDATAAETLKHVIEFISESLT